LFEWGGSATGVLITDKSLGSGGDGTSVYLFLGSNGAQVNTRGKIGDTGVQKRSTRTKARWEPVVVAREDRWLKIEAGPAGGLESLT
jgi:hypothetical protein